MRRPEIPFAVLRQFLLDLGFKMKVVPKSHVLFHHTDTEGIIRLPLYQGNKYVAPRHLLLVRLTLDAKGLVENDAFEDFVNSHSARRPRGMASP
jgi:hypothetical protein